MKPTLKVYCLSVKSIAKSTPHTKITKNCKITKQDQKETDLSCKYHNSVQVTVSTNPSPPKRIQVSKITADSISLKWDKPKISPTSRLLKYSVEITRVDPSSKEPLSIGSQSVESETEYVNIAALASGATYKMQVRVFTSEGDSSLSNPISAKTTFEETDLDKFRKSLNLAGIETDIAKVYNSQQSTERKLTTAEGKLRSAERKLSSAEGKIRSAERKLSTAEGKIHSAERKLSSAEVKIQSLSHTGSWCAYQHQWTSGNSVITYQKLLHADSNIRKYSLSSQTGKN